MSVPKRKRKEPKTAFYEKYYKLNDMIVRFIMKDFGMKPVTKDVRVFIKNKKVDEDDMSNMIYLFEKYNIVVESRYPEYMMDRYRNSILDILEELGKHITNGYTIYPESLEMLNFKKKEIYLAIASCESLLQKFQEIIRIFYPNVKVERFMPYTDIIMEEIKLLKKWKKMESKKEPSLIAKDNAKQSTYIIPEPLLLSMVDKLLKEKVFTDDKKSKELKAKDKNAKDDIKDNSKSKSSNKKKSNMYCNRSQYTFNKPRFTRAVPAFVKCGTKPHDPFVHIGFDPVSPFKDI